MAIFFLFFFLIVSIQTVFRCESSFILFSGVCHINIYTSLYRNYGFLVLQFSSSALNLKLSFFSKTEVIIIVVCTCQVASVMSDSWWPYGLWITLPDSSVHGLSRQEYWRGLPCPPPGFSSLLTLFYWRV